MNELIRAYFTALDTAMALDREISNWSPGRAGSFTERRAAWAEVTRCRSAIEIKLDQAPKNPEGFCQVCEGDHCTAKDGCVATSNPPASGRSKFDGPFTLDNNSYEPGFRDINRPGHPGFMRVVWKMEDEERSPKCEEAALFVLDALNSAWAAQQAADKVDLQRITLPKDLAQNVDDATDELMDDLKFVEGLTKHRDALVKGLAKALLKSMQPDPAMAGDALSDEELMTLWFKHMNMGGGPTTFAKALLKGVQPAQPEPASGPDYKPAFDEWMDKTEFIRNHIKNSTKYLGMHRADIMRDLIERRSTLTAHQVFVERYKGLYTGDPKDHSYYTPFVMGFDAANKEVK